MIPQLFWTAQLLIAEERETFMLKICQQYNIDCERYESAKIVPKMSLDLRNEHMSRLNHLIFTVKWIKNTHLVKKRPSAPHLSIVIARYYSKTL